MKLRTRRTFVIVEERFEEAGRLADQLLRRVAAVAVLENPYAGRYVEDLRPTIDASIELGESMAKLALAGFGQHEGKATARAESSASPASRSMRMRHGLRQSDSCGDRRRRILDFPLHQEGRAGHADRHSDEPQGRDLRALALRRHVDRAAGRADARTKSL